MNTITQTYRVARHCLALQMDAASPLWRHLGNYTPFETEKSDGMGNIFTLTVTDTLSVDTSHFILMMVCGDDDDCMKIEVMKGNDGEYLFGLRMPYSDVVNGRLLISSDYRNASLSMQGNEGERLVTLHRSLMLCYLLSTATMDTLLMHSSVVLNNGRGYLFMGRSGTGKSTHSSLWLKHIPGSELMNDDNPVVRIIDGVAWVFGSPWSGKTPCYRNVSAPIGGFVRLRQAKENHICLLGTVESYASLLTSSSGMSWETMLADGKSRALQQLIATVPCWLLRCLPDEAAARLCADTVRKDGLCSE